MSVVVFTQARSDSTRLPGKVLKQVLGRTMLEFHIRRVAQITHAHQHVVVTSTESNDDVICQHVKSLQVTVMRGSKRNVLERFVNAAKEMELSDGDHIVRLTGDCPLVDPKLVDELIQLHLGSGADYSNIDVGTIPRGFDAEVFKVAKLFEVFQAATEDFEQEHVTPYFYQHPELFQCQSLSFSPPIAPHLRLCVDEARDFEVFEHVVKHFGRDIDLVSATEIVDYLNCNPEVAELNAAVAQKKLQEDAGED
ncbi:cytidylyltransferase domain-containing protein [Pseudoalteromonas 'SMAR']|uniref:cytidylyltransferase domain-containing protein n=1 Tax=Pseudoalteromonas 'SMAR' TaxID=3416908 RepID=UPI003AF316CD